MKGDQPTHSGETSLRSSLKGFASRVDEVSLTNVVKNRFVELEINIIMDPLQPENQPDVNQNALLEGELLILYKNANFLIKRSDYNLDQLTRGADVLLRPFGMQGTEAIGGKLYLTNYRLLFTSHAFNRVTGTFSIYLSTITDVKNTSILLARKFMVSTTAQSFEFVTWNIPHLISVILSARDNLNPHL